MLVFAFTCLALVLYGVAIFFAYRQARFEFNTALRNAVRKHRVQIKALEDRWMLTERKVERIALAQAGTPNKPGTSAVNPFQRNEEFHAQQLKQVVEVNGERTRTASK